jgi:CDGSH iron-sulfur domain-containing protein 3
MAEPVIAQKGPYAVQLEAGRSYLWCSCGRSATQPFCDGSHVGSGMAPIHFQADETKTEYLCGCKHSANKPFCDGTHAKL